MDGHCCTFAVFLLLLILIPMPSYAQSAGSDGVSIDVEARVRSALDIVTIRNIGFGQVQPGQKEIRIDPILDQEAGKIRVNGSPFSEVTISFIENQRLQQVNGDGYINFNFILSGNREDEQRSSELLDFDNRSAVLNETGNYYFWVGGIANVENLKPGQYSGDFTIEIEHN